MAQNQLLMRLQEMESVVSEQQSTIQFLKTENESQSEFINKVKQDFFMSAGKLSRKLINKARTMKSMSPDKKSASPDKKTEEFKSVTMQSQLSRQSSVEGMK